MTKKDVFALHNKLNYVIWDKTFGLYWRNPIPNLSKISGWYSVYFLVLNQKQVWILAFGISLPHFAEFIRAFLLTVNKTNTQPDVILRNLTKARQTTPAILAQMAVKKNKVWLGTLHKLLFPV